MVRVSSTTPHPGIVAASTRGTRHTHTYVNSSDHGHQPYSARAVRVVKLFSMADSRTEKLRVLLPASNSRRCIDVPFPAVIDYCDEINAALDW